MKKDENESKHRADKNKDQIYPVKVGANDDSREHVIVRWFYPMRW